MCKEDYIWNPATCSCKNDKYLARVIDVSGITWEKIIDTRKTLLTIINIKKITCKTKNFYILLTCLLITIALLIVVIVYCYLIKY